MGSPLIHVDEATEAIVEAYRSFELNNRRLCELTVANACYQVRHYLAWRATTGRGDLGSTDAGELHDYVLHEAGRLSFGGARTKLATLRTFTRFLFATGITPSDLTGCVPSVSGSRFDGLPKAIDHATLQALLDTCVPTTRCGRRDYAILLLMSRLGLRAVEVSRMQLEDLDWRAGEFVVRGTAGRRDRLPLPADVGQALAEYLSLSRRKTHDRSVFLQAVDPPVGMS